jgi:hypothetical protein
MLSRSSPIYMCIIRSHLNYRTMTEANHVYPLAEWIPRGASPEHSRLPLKLIGDP